MKQKQKPEDGGEKPEAIGPYLNPQPISSLLREEFARIANANAKRLLLQGQREREPRRTKSGMP